MAVAPETISSASTSFLRPVAWMVSIFFVSVSEVATISLPRFWCGTPRSAS